MILIVAVQVAFVAGPKVGALLPGEGDSGLNLPEERVRKITETLRGSVAVVSLARNGAGELLTHWDIRKTRGAWEAARAKLADSLPPVLGELSRTFPREAERLALGQEALERSMKDLLVAAENKLTADPLGDPETAKAAMDEVLETWQEATRKAVELESQLLRLGEDVSDRMAREVHERERSAARLLWVIVSCVVVLSGLLVSGLVFTLKLRATAGSLDRANGLLQTNNRQLARTEARTRSILEGASEGILTMEASGRIAAANPAAERMFGAAPGALGGRAFEDLILSSWSGLQESRVAQFQSTGKRSDGVRFPVEIAFSEVAVDGDLISTALIRDITERKAAEAAILENQRLLSEAQEMGHFGSWEWEIATDRVVWSEELFRIFGLEAGVFTPSYTTYLDRVHPDDRSSVAQTVEKAVRLGEHFTYECRI
ncbi:MAG TPA: PAS domain S-box protein, partial [Planctomycetota bacterium]|nr:PAS domain S-box protein [Planctomycetota bacterium]